MFAKLFGPETDQVLVVATTDSKGRPEVHITTEADVLFDGAERKELVMVVFACNSHAEAQTLLTNCDEIEARFALAEPLSVLAMEQAKQKGLLNQMN